MNKSSFAWYVRRYWCVPAALLILVVLVAAGYARFGSLESALAHLRGDRLYLRQTRLDIGTGRVGEVRRAAFEFVNLDSAPIVLVGSASSCSCTSLSEMPLTIPAGQSEKVSVDVRFTAGNPANRRFSRTIVFYTNSQAVPTIAASIEGAVQGPIRSREEERARAE